MDNQVKKAIEVFNSGGIVIFPTDTAFGIGCRIDNKNAVEKLFKIRRRPENKSLLVLVDSVKMAEKYLLPIPQKVRDNLINFFWPGELTIILKCNSDKVLFPVRDERGTLGVRFPNNKMLQELIGEVGVPIVAPSANFSGEKTPFRYEDLNPKLVELADYVLKEKVTLGESISTIIDCTVEPWKIIREGVVKIHNL